jgi:hypothetical protein
MKMLRLLTGLLLGAVMAASCGSSTPAASTAVTDNPYETCYANDICLGGLTCAQTTLPASSAYTGFFCTSGCNYNSDCVQVPSNYNAACVDGQCYLTCPAGSSTCPYDQGCFTFDSNVGPLDLCTP